MTKPSLATVIQEFFLKRLINQKNASPHTVASYRDTFRLLFEYLGDHLHTMPCNLSLQDLEPTHILGFLDHLESVRNNSVSSRNARFAAIKTFFRYCAYLYPERIGMIQQVLAIPLKRSDHADVGFLTTEEIQAIIHAVDVSTWSGLRDHTMFVTLYNTGARVSEITTLKIGNVSLGNSPTILINGKGRKQRTMPLWKQTVTLLRTWIKQLEGSQSAPLFPNSRGAPMTRHGLEHRLRLAKKAAEAHCPSLKDKHLSPHMIRHTTAMHLLQSGVDITVIALWLGHEQPTTTHKYLKADLAMKERALERLSPLQASTIRFKPEDPLLRFLESL